MSPTATLRGIYADYLEQVDTLMKDKNPADGLFGLGNAPQNAPCHTLFDQQVAVFVRQQTDLDAAELTEVVALLLRAEKDHPAPDCAAWMMIAAQRHSLALIPRISREAAAELLKWYAAAYPVFRRLPVQKEVIRQLRKRAQ